MASYYCRDCADHYPKHSMFNNCPACGEVTAYRRHGKPTVDMEEGERRLKYVEFARWCAEHDRQENANPPIKLYLPEGADVDEARLASELSDAMEEWCPSYVMGELHVFV